MLRAAIVHAQFETIHPFEDGNGRTGRALIHTVLNAAGLARGAVTISTALSRDRDGYHDALNATRVVCGHDEAPARSAASSVDVPEIQLIQPRDMRGRPVIRRPPLRSRFQT